MTSISGSSFTSIFFDGGFSVAKYGAQKVIAPDRADCGNGILLANGKPVAGTVCDAIINHHYLKEQPSLTTHPHPLSSKY